MENEVKEKLCDRIAHLTSAEFSVIRQMAWDAYLSDQPNGMLKDAPDNKAYLYRAAHLYFTANEMLEWSKQRRVNKLDAQEPAQG